MSSSNSRNLDLKSLPHPPNSEESAPTSNSSSCHVFMTESPVPGGGDEAVMQAAKEFQFDPERTEDGLGFKEFPVDSDPIIEAVMNNYGKGAEGEEVGGGTSSPFPDVTFSSIESSPAKSSANR